MRTGSPWERRHGSAKAPTNTRGLATFRGTLSRPSRARPHRHGAGSETRNAPAAGSAAQGVNSSLLELPLGGLCVGLGPEVVSKALWKELSAYLGTSPIQGSPTPVKGGNASMSTSLRLPQTASPLVERNQGPRHGGFAANERAFAATKIGCFGGMRQEFPICGKAPSGVNWRQATR